MTLVVARLRKDNILYIRLEVTGTLPENVYNAYITISGVAKGTRGYRDWQNVDGFRVWKL